MEFSSKMDSSKNSEKSSPKELTNVKYGYSSDLPRTAELNRLILENEHSLEMDNKVEDRVDMSEFEFHQPIQPYADEIFEFNKRVEEKNRRLKED